MKEALKLALEALRTERDIYRENDEDGAPEYIIEAITAIKAALAQDEASSSRAAQEPVAWLDEEKKIIYWHNTHETDDYHGFKRTTPLYTTPQQRPWGKPLVSLTDEEIHDTEGYDESRKMFRFAHALIAKMMEKNT